MKKLNRILSLSAAAALALSLTACSGGPSGTADTPAGGSSNTPAAGETYKVAVIKQMDHASLDEIANAITARLDAIAEENGITIEYEVTSGQGDQTVLRQLYRPGHCRRCGRHYPHRHHRRPGGRRLR